jgi:hypothetical protein
MGISDILSLLEKYGLKSGFVVFLVVTIYLIFKSGIVMKFINKISEKYFEYFLNKKEKNKIVEVTVSDIENHDIFNYIDFWMYSRIPTFNFSTDYRTVVFRKYLTIYLRKHKEKLHEFVTSKAFISMNDSELWKNFLSLTNNIVYAYEREMKDAQIPEIIIEKMKSKNNDTISLTIDLIESICNSQFYQSENNLLKIYSILNIMLSILENTIHNSESVCDSINGQLKGLVYHEGGDTYEEP